VRDREGHPIRLTMLTAAGSKLLAGGTRLRAEMRRAGILVDLVPTDAATILARSAAAT
jgi:hypothetical protein